jgi:hypothetical protein
MTCDDGTLRGPVVLLCRSSTQYSHRLIALLLVTFADEWTVDVMEPLRARQVAAALARSRSVRRGVIACSSLDPDDALREMALVLSCGLIECRALLESLAGHDVQMRMLLGAEKYWMEALLEIVTSSSSAAEETVAEVLKCLPDDE